MDYLLKASAILLIFYLFYKFVLQHETFFQSNRIFLLLGIIATIFIPLIVIPIYIDQTIPTLQNFTSINNTDGIEIINPIDWKQIILWGYFSGVLYFGSKFLISLFSIAKLLMKSPKEKNETLYFIESEQNDSPFSFFNFIVYNPNSFKPQELQQILTHEKVHAYQWHSFDVLLSQLAIIFFWFNPISWLYKKELQQNLEFIADAISQENAPSQKSYQQLLLKTSISKYQLSLTNNFYNSLIKKRIIMLHKNKSKKTNQWKFTLILPLIVAFIFAFNTKTIAQTIVKKIHTTNNNKGLAQIVQKDIQMQIITKDSKQSDLDAIKDSFKKEGVKVKFKGVKRNSKNKIIAIKIDASSNVSNANFNTSSDSPIKPIKISFTNKGRNIAIGNGGVHHGNGDLHFVSKDGNHMIQSSGKRQQNYVFVSDDDKHKEHQLIEINVDSDGDEHEIIEIKGGGDSVFIIKKDGEDNESILELKSTDDKKVWVLEKNEETTWIDKDQRTTVDIIATDNTDGNMVFISDDGDAPIFYIDGKETTKEAMEKLGANKIEKVEVLKGDEAVEKYGNKAKNGAILITTKKE